MRNMKQFKNAVNKQHSDTQHLKIHIKQFSLLARDKCTTLPSKYSKLRRTLKLQESDQTYKFGKGTN